MRSVNLFLLLGIAVFFISCSSGNFMDYKDIAKNYNLPVSVEQSNYPEEDGVILYTSTKVDMDLAGSSVTTKETVHRIKKLFKNIEKYAFVEIPVYNYEKLRNISARTIKADGSVVVLNSDDFHEASGESEGSSFYTDKKTIKFTFPSIEKNCIIEYEYTKQNNFPFMNDMWFIQDNLPTLHNSYTFSLPKLLVRSEANGGAGWDWLFKTYNYYLDKPEVTEQSIFNDMGRDKITYTWTLSNILPLKEEEMMPAAINYLAYVRFAPSDWKTWNDISEWYYKYYFEPQMQVTSDVESLAEKLTKGCTDKVEKIRKLYDYVKGIRYVSISLGSGNLKPSIPSSTLERQYGDCKDKSTLLISLLKAAGIESKPVLALTSDDGVVDPDFPSWNFNHMIVKASGDNKEHYWLDATAKYCSLGDLPSGCQNINVLVLNPDYTSKIERTPGSKTDHNFRDIDLTINLMESGLAELDACIKYYGASNSSIRYKFEDNTEKEMKEYCKSLIADQFPGAEIKSYELSDVDSLKSIYSLKFKADAGSVIQKQGDLLMLSPDPLKWFQNISLFIKDKREYPIDYDYPYSIKKNITIKLPDAYSVRNLPEKLNQSTDDLDYSKEMIQKEHSVLVAENFKLRNAVISSDKYTTTKNFFERIKKKSEEKIILLKK